MYDELVKRLHEQAVYLPEKFSKNAELLDVLMKAADAIEELSKKYLKAEIDATNLIGWLAEEHAKHLWIPVTEQLPEREKKKYWVCTDTGYQCECRWTNNRFGIRESDEWGWIIFDIPQYQKVVAWMSLPDPYEPPKEEER